MPEPTDRWIERMLTESRPMPEQRWERGAERALLASARRRPVFRRPRPLALATGLTALLAAGFVSAGLLGGGPLSPSGADSVQAKPECAWVQVRTVETVNRIVVGADGEPDVVAERKPVTRSVKRCR